MTAPRTPLTLAEMTAQRDELLAALKEARSLVGSLPNCAIGITETHNRWSAAIRRAERPTATQVSQADEQEDEDEHAGAGLGVG